MKLTEAVLAGPVGVPVMAPVLLFKLSPAGNDPAEIEYVSVPAPPVTAMVWLYAVPTAPPGREAVVIEGGAVTSIIICAVLDASDTSVAVTVAVVSAAAGAL